MSNHITRYFPVLANDANIDAIVGFSVGDLSTIRESVDKTKLAISLFPDDHSTHPELDAYQEYDNLEFQTLLEGPEWVNDD